MKYLKPRSLRSFVSSCLLAVIVCSGCPAFALEADQTPVIAEQIEDYQQVIEAWRASRLERLTRPDGWLTLVGLEWLKDGENRIGSAADNDIRLSGGPAYWGSVFLQDDGLRFVNSGERGVTVNGESVQETSLVFDTNGEPTVVASGNLSFYAIFRESFALRVKDSRAPALMNFKGVENFPIDETWRVNGRFIRAAEDTTIEIANVLGQVSETPVYGTFEFDMDGKTHRLLGLGTSESDSLWFIFTDRTTGHGTYGAGRFLYSDSMPKNGRLTVDFNKAYNPPCAFNPYSTCPLPPQENRLDVQVMAGEKDFHPASD